MERDLKRILNAVIAFCLVGLAVSTYAFFHNRGFASGEFCKIGETFNCDIVNKGPYSVIAGVPVAAIGILGYLFLLAAALLKSKDRRDRSLTKILVGASLGGVAFALYLTGIEALVLKTFCLLCLTSQVSILAILILSFCLWRAERHPSNPSHSSNPS